MVTTVRHTRKADTELVVNSGNAFPDDSFSGLYGMEGVIDSVAVLEPPFNPGTLYALTSRNNTLAQCIEAMEVNIDGTGHVIALNDGEKDGSFEKEKTNLEDFFNNPYPGLSMTEIRRHCRRDVEATGNAYLNVLRNAADEIILLVHLDCLPMRLVRMDAPVTVEKEVFRNGATLKVKVSVCERRFVQLINGRKVYFKEFQASRDLNRDTGEWALPGQRLPANKRASEIIHFVGNKEPKSPYGVPRWINQLPSVLGSRKAEEFNLDYFDSGGLPPVLVVVQGGTLGSTVRDELVTHLSGGAGSHHRAAVVEAVSTSGSLDSAGSVQVKVERFGCVDALTECLTEDGWIFIRDWCGQKVGTVIDGRLEYQAPLRYHEYAFDGMLLHIEGRSSSFCVTPNHKVQRFLGKNGEAVFEEASKSFERDCLVVATAPELGSSQEIVLDFLINGERYSAGHCFNFLGYALKENLSEEVSGWHPRVLKSIAGPVSLTERGDNSGLREWLKVKVGLERVNKRIPTEFLSLGQLQSECLLSIVFSIGGYPNGTGSSYMTPSRCLADDLQTLALHAGHQSVISSMGSAGYLVTISKGTKTKIRRSKCAKWREVYYRGNVFCFTMPSGVFISRRGGKVCVTGNSDRMSDAMFQEYDKSCEGHLRVAFRLPPLFIGRSEDYTFASAYTSCMIAEAQVFAPERYVFDKAMDKIVKELGGVHYHFRSLPVTLTDVANQLKGLEMVTAADSVEPESVVKAIAEITGLNLDFKKSSAPQPSPAPAVTSPPSNPVQPGATPPKPKPDTVQLIAKLFGECSKSSPTEDDRARIHKALMELDEPTLDKVSSLVASLAISDDYTGISELCGCALSLQES